jgi:hypothetical protein
MCEHQNVEQGLEGGTGASAPGADGYQGSAAKRQSFLTFRSLERRRLPPQLIDGERIPECEKWFTLVLSNVAGMETA